MKNSFNKILYIIAITIITGLVAAYIISTNANKNRLATTTNEIKEQVTSETIVKKDTSSDTSVAKHTIVIENVKDPRQLQQILQILENYSTENKIKDLNIKCEKTSKNSLIKR